MLFNATVLYIVYTNANFHNCEKHCYILYTVALNNIVLSSLSISD